MPGHRKAWVVSLTPFDAQGGLDEAGLRLHLRRMRDGGQSAYVGSTNIGEGFALEHDELEQVLAIAVDELKGTAGVRASGFEARSVAEARRSVRMAEAAKVDAAHVFQLDVGHGSSKPDSAELERFYCHVLEHTSLPVVLSNYPSLGYSVPVDVLGRLLDRFPHIISIRDAGGDLGYFSELVRRFSGRVELYAVGVKSLATTLLLGADGIFTTEANITPKLVSSVLEAYEAGDLEAMQARFRQLVQVHRLLARYGGSGGRGMKSLLNHFELPGGSLRPPRLVIGEVEQTALVEAFSALGIAELQA